MTTLEFRTRQAEQTERDARDADILVSAVCLVSTLIAAYHFFQWVPQ